MEIPHITPEQVAQYGVVASPDRLTGKPADNKAIFDRLVRELVTGAVNNVIDQTNLLLVAEDNRTAQETGRVNAETLRVAAEQLRVSAETARIDAEQVRNTAEKNRNDAETARKTAQDAWVKAEAARVASEVLRVEAEKARATAETARKTAEDQRVARDAAESLCAPYDPLRDYATGNKAVQSGSTYRCIAPCRGVTPPDSTKWLLVAAKGADGLGTGDMTANIYDPTGQRRDVFAFASALAGADIDCGTFDAGPVAAHNESQSAHRAMMVDGNAVAEGGGGGELAAHENNPLAHQNIILDGNLN